MSADLIQESIAHFKLNVVRVDPVAESYSSLVRLLTLAGGERLILKIPFIQRKLFRELAALQRLKGDLPVPEVVDFWIREDENPGALLLSLLPGKVISGKVTPTLAYGMGVLLGSLHAQELDRYGDVLETSDEPSLDWWTLHKRAFQQWHHLCMDVMPEDLFNKALDRYDCLYSNLPEPCSPSWVHRDYRPGNVLIQAKHITGLIDFESARGGSGDMDFVKIKQQVWDLWPETKEPFLQGYASIRQIPDFENTMPFYELSNAFGGIAWCVKRSKIEDPFFAENMKMLEQILQ
jgi:hypothetical protein